MPGGTRQIAPGEPVGLEVVSERLPAPAPPQRVIEVSYFRSPGIAAPGPATQLQLGRFSVAVSTGVILALALIVCLEVLGRSAGIVGANPVDAQSHPAILTEKLWSVLSTLVALTAGGWLAGWRCGGGLWSGLLHGVAVGVISALLLAAFALVGDGSAAGDIAWRLTHLLESRGGMNAAAADPARPALTRSALVDGLLAIAMVLTSAAAGACIGRNDRRTVLRRRAVRLARGR